MQKSGSHRLSPRLYPLHFSHTEKADNDQLLVVLDSARWHWLNLNGSRAHEKAADCRNPLEEKGKGTFVKKHIKMPDCVLCNFIYIIFCNSHKKS